MYKRLLALFLVAMLVLPATAIATGKSDADAKKTRVGKSLERTGLEAADGENENGDVGTKDRREKADTTGRAGSVSATEDDDEDTASTNGKLRKPIKLLKTIRLEGAAEDTETRALRKAEKEAYKAAKQALKEQHKAERRALRAERKPWSIDNSSTIDNSITAESTGTARGLQRAAAAITANIQRMVDKFDLEPLGDGFTSARMSLTRVLSKLNTWVELILAGEKKNPGNDLGSNENTETSSTTRS